MSKNEIIKRYVLFVISLFFAALGVAFTKRGELGVSPISSVQFIPIFVGVYIALYLFMKYIGNTKADK